MEIDTFLRKIEHSDATIGVVGLGYVGLPLVLTFGKKNYRVIGFDIDKAKTDKLQAGKSYIRHIPNERISELIESKRFEPTANFELVSECDAILLCVPTPLTANREPNMTFVAGTANSIAPYLRKGQLIVLESTTYTLEDASTAIPVGDLNSTPVIPARLATHFFSPKLHMCCPSGVNFWIRWLMVSAT